QKRIETGAAAEAAVPAPAPPQIPEPDAALSAASSLAAPSSPSGREPAPPPEALAKALGEMAALRDQIAELGPSLAALAARVAALEKQPLPAKAAIRAVAKARDSEDAAGGSVDDAVKRLAALPSEERAYALM